MPIRTSSTGNSAQTASMCRHPIYTATAAYGHFGRDEPDVSWERPDIKDILKETVKYKTMNRGSVCACPHNPMFRRQL